MAAANRLMWLLPLVGPTLSGTACCGVPVLAAIRAHRAGARTRVGEELHRDTDQLNGRSHCVGDGVGDGDAVGVGRGVGGGGGGNAIASNAAAKTSGLTRSWFVTTAMLKPDSGR